MTGGVEFRVLGPLEVLVDGARLALGGAKQQAVLAVLLIEPNRVVSAERLIELLWGEDAGDRALATLQVHVSNLRRTLTPASATRGGRDIVETRRPGYCAVVEDDELDLLRFEQLVAGARDVATTVPTHALEQYRAALALWRGPPLAGLESIFAIGSPATRLDRQHTAALEQRLGLELELGNASAVLGEITGLMDREPLNERLRGLLMLALYQCGRQAEALECYQRGREALAEQLGLSPSPELRELEARILDQDTALRPGPARPGSPVADDLGTVIRSSVLRPRAVVIVGEQRYVLDHAVVTLGRRADRDIVVDDARASRAHAEIRLLGEDFVLADMGSSNGTLIDGKAIRECVLHSGDEIRIGDTVLRFELSGSNHL